MCSALSATLLGLQQGHNHWNVARRQSTDNFCYLFLHNHTDIFTAIASTTIQHCKKQFNLAAPPLLVILGHSQTFKPILQWMDEFGHCFSRKYPRNLSGSHSGFVWVSQSLIHHHCSSDWTAGITSSLQWTPCCSVSIGENTISSSVCIFSFVLQQCPGQLAGGLANPCLIHHSAGRRANVPQQVWWSVETTQMG